MRNRIVGYMVLGFAAAMSFIIYSFNSAMRGIVEASCTHGPSCTMWGTIDFQTNVSIAITVFVAALGLYLVFFSREERLVTKVLVRSAPSSEDRAKKWAKALSGLEGEEKAVFGAIAGSNGSMLQSALIEKTGLQKVKVTRVLDRLEGKGLIERRRRGMSNVVMLKH